MATPNRRARPEVVARLVANHRAFLSFLERRVATRAVAEEILQDAFVRALGRGGGIRDDESAVAWFYRLLRNALIDHHRRRSTEAQALERAALEQEDGIDDELYAVVCACVTSLIETLPEPQAEILREVDLAGDAVSVVADRLSITANNASVRLHRARQALKTQLERSCGTCAEHGCLDCGCGGPHAAARPGPPRLH